MAGRIGFVVTCWLLAWLAIFLALCAYAPFHFLRKVRAELARLRGAPVLELLFGDDPQFIRPNRTLHGPSGEFYSIGIRNSGTQTLDDVTVRALDSWFTREAIAVAQGSGGSGPVEIISLDALHPGAQEFKQCFGLDYHTASSAPEYIFNTVQRFTLEATARNTPAVRREFEYNPATRPMLKMITV